MPSFNGIFDIFRILFHPLSHYKKGRSAVNFFQLIHKNGIHLHIRTVVIGKGHHRLLGIQVSSSRKYHPLRIRLSFGGTFLFRTFLRFLLRRALRKRFHCAFLFFLLCVSVLLYKTEGHGKSLEYQKQAKYKKRRKNNSCLPRLRFLSSQSCSSLHKKELFFFRKISFSFYIAAGPLPRRIIFTSVSEFSFTASKFSFICHV